MNTNKIYLGKTCITSEEKEVIGSFVEIENEKYYKISNYCRLNDFFISIISNSNHWMFISSNGSLSAGRNNRDNALFPYYTEDKIHDYKGITGNYSCFIVEHDKKSFLWEPFTCESDNAYSIERNIYKSFYGNKIIFEEINHDLGISFNYSWCNSEKYGFVKKSTLINKKDEIKKIQLLDGIKNILPSGVDYNFQNEYSNLLDAYKKNELIKESLIGLFTLSAVPVDRAEPSESLYANTVWSQGFKNPKILISNNQINNFKKGITLETEFDIRASRGAYLINDTINLKPNNEKKWIIVTDINQDSASVSNLNQLVLNNKNLQEQLEKDIDKGTESLKKIASSVDGLQVTNTELCYARHYSNSIYNVMRGGVYANGYWVDINDYKNYLHTFNKMVNEEVEGWIEQLPEKILYTELIRLVEDKGNADLTRITYEYLPLTFSRRHGDPSRPWNLFSIETKNDDGSIKYNYEGNWRDIFQNWEALCYSFPEFTEGIISKFVNASTIDGYNPYRITRNGIDWERPDPNDPWAYIGYWGDHQIIYLQKLLEVSDKFHPGKLNDLFSKEIFTYANVPYQIKSYNEIVINPKDTIIFNKELDDLIKVMEDHVGADARLIKNRDVDKAYKVNLMEKILVTVLSKLSNFIPEAGIWLNTQRPEWNDANNALVGNGTSMVTLYYLRRFLKFWDTQLKNFNKQEIEISSEVVILFENIAKIFNKSISYLNKGFTDTQRREITDLLGKAHEEFRIKIYKKSFYGNKRLVGIKELIDFVNITLKHIDHSIKVNKRKDGLYHAYNLISISDEKITIRHLYEMLEGQVSVLSAGVLTSKEDLEVLDALKNSKMFRSDQYSYMLYPDRQLTRFTDKNTVPKEKVKESKLLIKLLDDKNTSIIKTDVLGNFYFNSEFRNAELLKMELANLKQEEYKKLLEEEKNYILNLYEETFDHQSFTGRSGTFYGYEGLGSIYWHMVSKLLLATQECYFKAINENAPLEIVNRLKDHYYEIKAGIGLYKSPELYGAFPTDAYSHTPGNSGVKQPGLTGQVKEDVISRLGELGIRIHNGMINFDVSLLNTEEILYNDKDIEYYAINGKKEIIQLRSGELGLTFCQVPVVYKHSDNNTIICYFENRSSITIKGNNLNKDISQKIFKRTGEVKMIEVFTALK